MTGVLAIDQITTETIRRKLEAVEQGHGVQVLFAVESGSRAWGFPSPDSDYDVRFVYRHPRDWYLSLAERRDVIEIPIDVDDHDISGWDLRKALQLLLRSNPPLYEWLVSPIVYVEEGDTMARLRTLAERGYAQKTMGWHYLRMGERTYRTHFGSRTEANLKKYFYVVRPLCALRWLMERGMLPPMNLGALLEGISLPTGIRRAIDRLLEQKTRSSELGKGRRMRALDRWIESELRRGEARCGTLSAKTSILPEAEAYFRGVVGGTDKR